MPTDEDLIDAVAKGLLKSIRETETDAPITNATRANARNHARNFVAMMQAYEAAKEAK
jgi:hypothetical protein